MKLTEVTIERRAVEALTAVFATIPGLIAKRVEREVQVGQGGAVADLVAELAYDKHRFTIVAEIKANGQPRIVRDTARQLKDLLKRSEIDATPMIIAPYLSPQSQEACREEQVAWLDFEGNVQIAVGAVYIERQVATRPPAEQRALRSIFKPKAARMLRAMLRDPDRRWRVAELASAVGISFGQVSNVSKALRERGWAESTDEGLHLVEPSRLLEAWAEDYERPNGEEVRLYTTLHGKQLTERLRGLEHEEGRVALASYSAADWLAPFARHPTSYFYADEKGLAALRSVLDTSQPPSGANLSVLVPDDDGVLIDAQPVTDGIMATGVVQTYLDLVTAGERGREAAEMLRNKCLVWA